MKNDGKTAIVLGATGVTGELVLQLLLTDTRYKSVVVFARRSTGITHFKLQEHIIDLFNLLDYKNDFLGDEVYCCIGTTKAKTPKKEDYIKIDLGIPVAAGKLCVSNKIKTFIVISALGAKVGSPIFYNRVKGEMESIVLKLSIPFIYILQPSLIDSSRDERRLMEKFIKHLFYIVNPLLIGRLRKFRSIEPMSIAKSMIWLANNTYPSGRLISDKIVELSSS